MGAGGQGTVEICGSQESFLKALLYRMMKALGSSVELLFLLSFSYSGDDKFALKVTEISHI